jgi:methionyl-tRNA formyltransferase
MKIVFMGATKFSEAILLDLISKQFKMEAIFTIPQIELEDTIKEVSEKATEASRGVLVKVLSQIEGIRPKLQSKSHIKIYPQRRLEDGEIDLKKTALEIYNFIMAQSSPYPGTLIKTADGKRLVIEKVRVEDPKRATSEAYG